jgi:hypothetical protein
LPAIIVSVQEERPACGLGLDASLQLSDRLGVGGRVRGHGAIIYGESDDVESPCLADSSGEA